MAKVTVNFDTKDKSLNVSMNGQSIDNIRSVEFFEVFDEEGFAMSIRTVEVDENEKMARIMIVNAKDELVEDKNSLRKRIAKQLFPDRIV